MRTIVLNVPGLGVSGLGCYGNEWIATPEFDRLAADGVVFDNHYLEAFDSNPIDVVVDRKDGGPPLKKVRSLGLPDCERIWIESDAFAEPWFAPAEIIKDYADEGLTQARFAAMMTCLDASFGELRKLASDAVWIATSNRGSVTKNIREACAHVPLIVAWPDGRHAGTRIMNLTSQAKLEEWLNDPVGFSLLSAERTVLKWGEETAIRTAEWTLISSGDSKQLFHRGIDRHEVNDVSRLHEEVLEAMISEIPKRTSEIGR